MTLHSCYGVHVPIPQRSRWLCRVSAIEAYLWPRHTENADSIGKLAILHSSDIPDAQQACLFRTQSIYRLSKGLQLQPHEHHVLPNVSVSA